MAEAVAVSGPPTALTVSRDVSRSPSFTDDELSVTVSVAVQVHAAA